MSRSEIEASGEGPGACGDIVYLSGTYNVLGTGIPSSGNWVATD